VIEYLKIRPSNIYKHGSGKSERRLFWFMAYGIYEHVAISNTFLKQRETGLVSLACRCVVYIYTNVLEYVQTRYDNM